MRVQTSRRWRRFGAATAAVLPLGAVLALATGCSGGSSPGAAAPATPAVSATTAPSADPAAVAALASAVRVTTVLRSYAFVASQRLTGGSSPQATVLTGRAVRPAAIAYSLSVGGRTQQVITVGGRTYLRVPPAGWKVLAKPGATVDPLASLLTLLHDLTAPTLSGRSLTGVVPATVLSQAGLAPAGGTADAQTPVTLTLDSASRVRTVSLRLRIRAGSSLLSLEESTSFSAFNGAPPVRAPGTAVRK